MIEELLQVADNLGLSGEAFRRRPVHWLIELNAKGDFIGLTPTAAVSRIERNEIRTGEVRGKIFSVPANFIMTVVPAKDGKTKRVFPVGFNQYSWKPNFLTIPATQLLPEMVQSSEEDSEGKDEVDEKATDEIMGHGPALNEDTAGEESSEEDEKANEPSLTRKRDAARALVGEARGKLPDLDLLRAVSQFLDSEDAPSKLLAELERMAPTDEKKRRAFFNKIFNSSGPELFSFRTAGRLVFLDPKVREWWQNRFDDQRQEVMKLLPVGRDLYSAEEGGLTKYFLKVFGTIPFASFNSPAFRSYGLESQTSPLRVDTMERAVAAINWLADKKNGCCLTFDDFTALFWAKSITKTRATGFAEMMNEPDPLQIKEFFNNVWGQRAKPIEAERFHLALITKGTARFSVHSWRTEFLSNTEERLERFFDEINVPRKTGDADKSAELLQIKDLAYATIRRSRNSRPSSSTYVALFNTALLGKELPHDLYVVALQRQSIELSQGAPKRKRKEFERRLAARTAIIKLFFSTTKGASMKCDNLDLECDRAYICGRLLAMLDRIHTAAHYERVTNSSPANRVYSIASKSPALIFPQLMDTTRYHLNKINKGYAKNLEHGIDEDTRQFEGLKGICARLREASPEGFPRLLDLEEQGRFAIGFYCERCVEYPSKSSVANATQLPNPTSEASQMTGGTQQ